jgi:hypothetical protein
VLVSMRGHRAWQLRCCPAAWLAALLVIAPFARPSLPVDLVTVPATFVALAAHDAARGQQPRPGLRPEHSLTLGILSRLLSVETTLGLPPVKPPLLRPAADQPAFALQATTAFGGDLRGVFQPSSVGTARTPTGPPS